MNKIQNWYRLAALFLLGGGAVMAQQPNLEWAGQFQGYNVLGRYVNYDRQGNLITTGGIAGNCDIDPGPGSYPVTLGVTDQGAYLTKLDSLGTTLWTGAYITTPASNFVLVAQDVDSAGRIYVMGSVLGTVDVDIMPNSTHYVSDVGTVTHFLARYGPSGYLQYVRMIPTTDYNDGTWRMEVDAPGNVYINESFRYTEDLDPGPGVYNLTAPNQLSDAYILKLDDNGDFVWVKQIGGPDNDQGAVLKLGPNGDIYVSGYYGDSIDIDPGSGVSLLTNSNFGGYYFSRYDAQGNLVWGKQFESIGGVHVTNIGVDGANNLVVVGIFYGDIDLDPSPSNTVPYTNTSGYQAFFVKLDQNGNYLWGGVAGPGLDPRVIDVDAMGNIYCGGTVNGTVDMDLGSGTASFTHSSSPVVLTKFDSNGNYVWGAGLQNDGANHMIYDIDHRGNGTIAVTGMAYIQVEISPTTPQTYIIPPQGELHGIVFQWGESPCAATSMAIDNFEQITCTHLGQATASMTNGVAPYGYTWSTTPQATTPTASFSTRGIYTVTATDATGCSKARQVLITAPDSTAGLDLGTMIVAHDYRPGFQQTMFLESYNLRCDTASGTLSLNLDPLLSYVTANPAPSSVVGQSLSWDLGPINYDSTHLAPSVTVLTSLAAPLNLPLCNDIDVTLHPGDADTSNNHIHDCRNVIGSFDPNDMRVWPVGECDPRYIVADQPLTYTVRFQNVGNADAINVRLQAHLSPFLDLSTLQIIASSHTLSSTQFDITGNLQFRFDDIHLPDSTSDEPGSHGYLIFKIRPLPNLPIGTSITSFTAIFFDFNAPVITNEVENIITAGPHSPNTGISNFGNGLQALSVTGTLQWVDCDNNFAIIPGQNSTFYIPGASSGHYAVIVNEGGCIDTSECLAYPYVVGQPEPVAPRLSARAFPNPNRSRELHIALGDMQRSIDLEVVNMLGQIVLQERYVNVTQIDLTLPAQAGMYFLRLRGHGGEVVTLKVVRE